MNSWRLLTSVLGMLFLALSAVGAAPAATQVDDPQCRSGNNPNCEDGEFDPPCDEADEKDDPECDEDDGSGGTPTPPAPPASCQDVVDQFPDGAPAELTDGLSQVCAAIEEGGGGEPSPLPIPPGDGLPDPADLPLPPDGLPEPPEDLPEPPGDTPLPPEDLPVPPADGPSPLPSCEDALEALPAETPQPVVDALTEACNAIDDGGAPDLPDPGDLPQPPVPALG